MLEITVGGTESFDDERQKFVITGGLVVQLEHSLVSLSKWEATYEKPFLSKEEKTPEEVLTYVKCMLVDSKTPEEILHQLDEKHIKEIQGYIDAKMSATWFGEEPGAPKTSREVVTSELIYYWMTVFNIPFTCEHWHLNKLFTLIRVCNLKAEKPKKMGKGDALRRQQELNRQRRAQLGTKG